MSQPTVNQQTLDFVLQNLTAIRDIQQTKQQAINEYHHRLQAALQNKLGPDQDVSVRLNTWDGYPALRFALSSWAHSESDVVLLLSGEADAISFHVYACLRNGVDEKISDSLILHNFTAEHGFEGGKKIRTYSVRKIKMEEPEIIQFIYDRLLALDKFEKYAPCEIF